MLKPELDESSESWREAIAARHEREVRVHDHGPDEGPGLDCPERYIDGRLRGACIGGDTYWLDSEPEPQAVLGYITKDSGERIDFPSGMRRDTDKGKPRYDLIPRFMLRRIAELYARGAEKYGDNNWQLADSEQEMQRFRASAFRHFMQWLDGEVDEDHGAAVFFNIAAAEHVQRKVKGQKTLRDAFGR